MIPYNELVKLGLEDADINTLQAIDDNVMKIDFFTNLLIKSHNYGFKKGVNESIKTMVEIQNEADTLK